MKNWINEMFLNYIYVFRQSSRIFGWFKYNIIHALVIVLFVMIGSLLVVVFATEKGGVFAWILGTESKKETLEYIAYGIVAMLVLIGMIHLIKAKEKHNMLIEKGHVEDRFKSAIENLGRSDKSVKIAAFYQFYYLAKDFRDSDFRRNIFDILCAHLRNMTRDKSYKKEEYPTEECQTLLDILFRPEDKSVFDEFHANLRNVWLVHANLFCANLVGAEFFGANLKAAFLENANASGAFFPHANLENANLVNANFTHANFIGTNFNNANLMDADFTGANLMSANFTGTRIQNANFSNAELIGAHFTGANLKFVGNIEGANFLWAKIGDRDISSEDLPTNKGQYIAPWATDEFWAEVEKNEES